MSETTGEENEEPPRWRDWSNVKEEKENRIMTDGGEDELPGLSGLEEGNEVRLFYLSQRSGNEVKREGTVSSVIEDDEKRIVRVHAGNPEPLKHKFVSVMEATTESGREGVFAWSQTATAEVPFDGAPKVGKPYSVKFEFSRTSILGEVDRIVRTDRSTPIMMTDGGYSVPEEVGAYRLEERAQQGVAWRLPTGIGPDGELVLDDKVFTVTAHRASRHFDYRLRERKGSESLSPFKRSSPEPLASFPDRQDAIDVAVEHMEENQPPEEVMADGGRRVHPDDEGVEILETGNDDEIIVAGDDGEILTE